jgi:hypothetical protein
MTARSFWRTDGEGYFESPEMNGYLRVERREYLERTGKHLGCEDMQYATDCGVRFTHLGELPHPRVIFPPPR